MGTPAWELVTELAAPLALLRMELAADSPEAMALLMRAEMDDLRPGSVMVAASDLRLLTSDERAAAAELPALPAADVMDERRDSAPEAKELMAEPAAEVWEAKFEPAPEAIEVATEPAADVMEPKAEVMSLTIPLVSWLPIELPSDSRAEPNWAFTVVAPTAATKAVEKRMLMYVC